MECAAVGSFFLCRRWDSCVDVGNGLQREFDTLTDFFDSVGLRTNVLKMLIIYFQPCHALGFHYVEAYGLRIIGERQSHRDQLRQRVLCPNCDTDLDMGYLSSHIQVQHRLARGYMKYPPPLNPWTSPGLTGYPPRMQHAILLYQWEDARGGRQSAAHSGYTPCTATCGTR